VDVGLDICSYSEKRGSEQFELKLAEARGYMVRDYLVNQGVESNRLSVRPYGSTQPLLGGDSFHADKLNYTKVEFLIRPL